MPLSALILFAAHVSQPYDPSAELRSVLRAIYEIGLISRNSLADYSKTELAVLLSDSLTTLDRKFEQEPKLFYSWTMIRKLKPEILKLSEAAPSRFSRSWKASFDSLELKIQKAWSVDQNFPDIPTNHYFYEILETMKRLGLNDGLYSYRMGPGRPWKLSEIAQATLNLARSLGKYVDNPKRDRDHYLNSQAVSDLQDLYRVSEFMFDTQKLDRKEFARIMAKVQLKLTP